MPNRRKWAISLVMLCGLAVLPSREARSAEAFSRAADHAVVRYVEMLGEVAEADRGPALTVYGDGRAVAHYPRYMTRAGDHEVRLSSAELEALVGNLVGNGVFDFDAAAVRRTRVDAARARLAASATVTVRSSVSSSRIELALDRGMRRVDWPGVVEDAHRFPGIAALQGLAAARGALVGVMDRAWAARSR